MTGHERSLTPPARRAVGWIAMAVVAACHIATDVVTTFDVASVSITPTTTSVSMGSQIPLQALVQDPGGKTITGTDIFWSVQDASIATISSTGVVTGVALGSTQVAASVNGKSGIATITVEETPVSSVVVAPPHVDAAPGVQTQLAAVAYDAAQNPLPGRAITWSTSNAAVATVDANGMVSALSPGATTITATSETKSGTCAVTVSRAPVATVTVSPSNPPPISKNASIVLQAALKDASNTDVGPGRVVAWTTTDSKGIVTITPTVGTYTATVRGKKAGTITVTATSEGKTGTTTITVKP